MKSFAFVFPGQGSQSVGMLAPGESFSVVFDDVGVFEYDDGLGGGVIVVDHGGTAFLPMVRR